MWRERHRKRHDSRNKMLTTLWLFNCELFIIVFDLRKKKNWNRPKSFRRFLYSQIGIVTESIVLPCWATDWNSVADFFLLFLIFRSAGYNCSNGKYAKYLVSPANAELMTYFQNDVSSSIWCVRFVFKKKESTANSSTTEPVDSTTENAPDTADDHKERGNGCIRAGKYNEAVLHYSFAIKLSPNDPALYSNRSLAFLKLKQLYYANDDAEKAIQLKPDWAKVFNPQRQFAMFRMEE